MTVPADKATHHKPEHNKPAHVYPATYHREQSGMGIFWRRLLEQLPSSVQTGKAQSKMPARVLAQLGLGSGDELLGLWHAQRQLKTNTRLQLAVFESEAIDATWLQRHWEDAGILATEHTPAAARQEPHPWSPLAEQFIRACPARIIGCQRLSFDDGRFIVDLHFGPLLASLSTLAVQDTGLIHEWFIHPQYLDSSRHEKLLWQMARVSRDDARLWHAAGPASSPASGAADLTGLARKTGFALVDIAQVSQALAPEPTPASAPGQDAIALQERRALRHQTRTHQGFCPLPTAGVSHSPIAIIGGGLASAHLALSLAERGQPLTLFCQDAALAQGASGNKQGAIYPLLTPENGPLSRFFQQAFLFSRRRLQQLLDAGYPIAHDFCGVLQTGHDDRSQARLDKIIQGQDWPAEIATAVTATEANAIAKVSLDKAGFYYPLGGWVSPAQYTRAALAQAARLARVEQRLNTEIQRLEYRDAAWYLHSHRHTFGPFARVILAGGAQLTRFEQTKSLQISGFRGQVSHIPARPKLSKLATVLCANGYLTPLDDNFHCMGASYVKDAPNLDYSPAEQLENLHKMQHSYGNKPWVEEMDIRGHAARVGVRMVTRDHFPMMGCAPDVEAILAAYEQQEHTNERRHDSQHQWQTRPAPIHTGLYVLGGLGSRGLSSGPLAAECLAAQLCGETPPLDYPSLALLNPNRMWMRKLLKGKAL
ncbi:FAD-dependent 5-carboxymethylaminomethyl-2-thiouridine(34) oxidoreductase MnmC [Shewanella sp. AS16]|uniref:FAD-dependent 5-carboxymethylaminomethyl-2-thiouridine(34) oxidoreductase MnmC n=1 Tax=Shewanella sp. AS16 TaxID=2907625 RepID=UPI003FA349C7